MARITLGALHIDPHNHMAPSGLRTGRHFGCCLGGYILPGTYMEGGVLIRKRGDKRYLLRLPTSLQAVYRIHCSRVRDGVSPCNYTVV